MGLKFPGTKRRELKLGKLLVRALKCAAIGHWEETGHRTLDTGHYTLAAETGHRTQATGHWQLRLIDPRSPTWAIWQFRLLLPDNSGGGSPWTITLLSVFRTICNLYQQLIYLERRNKN